jgi:hypothetical protein
VLLGEHLSRGHAEGRAHKTHLKRRRRQNVKFLARRANRGSGFGICDWCTGESGALPTWRRGPSWKRPRLGRRLAGRRETWGSRRPRGRGPTACTPSPASGPSGPPRKTSHPRCRMNKSRTARQAPAN